MSSTVHVGLGWRHGGSEHVCLHRLPSTSRHSGTQDFPLSFPLCDTRYTASCTSSNDRFPSSFLGRSQGQDAAPRMHPLPRDLQPQHMDRSTSRSACPDRLCEPVPTIERSGLARHSTPSPSSLAGNGAYASQSRHWTKGPNVPCHEATMPPDRAR